MELFKRYQVALDADCVAHGGRQEYPDGWVGQEAIPAYMQEGVLQSAFAEVARATEALAKAQKARRGVKDARLALEKASERRDTSASEALADYANCGPRATERLRYLRFGSAFIGRNDRGQQDRKTDSQNGMWIPEWQLRTVVEAETAPVAA